MTSALIDGFRRREESAVRGMYREYGRLVFGVAYRVLGRDDLAEEAVQLTFLRAWQAADRFDVERDPAPWLARIARNCSIDVYRREKRRAASPLDEVGTEHPSVVTQPLDLDAVDAVWHVRRAIEALAPDEAEVVRLQHLTGLTHTEISERLGIALGTVKSRSHRAHRHLAATLGHLRSAAAL